jgi:hypothetical protein
MRTVPKPLLVSIGAAGLAAETIGKTVEAVGQVTFGPIDLWYWVEEIGTRAHSGYRVLAQRGELALQRITAQPAVSRALRNAQDAGREFDGRLQYAVDEFNDISEEAMGRMSEQTWQLRQRARRAASSVVPIPWVDELELDDPGYDEDRRARGLA